MPKHTYYRFDDKFFIVPYNLSKGHAKIPVIGFAQKDGGISQFLSEDFELMLKDHAKKIYDSRAGTEMVQ